MNLNKLSVAFLWVLTSQYAYANQSLTNLPMVTVNSGHPHDFLSHSFISRQAIESTHYANINAQLYGEPAVNLVQSNSTGFTSITLRGASGGQGLVTFDGVPIFANFAAIYSMRHFPSDVVEDVSVQRGFSPNASNSRTLGGSINLRSRRVDNGSSHVHLEIGSNKTLTTSLATGWGEQGDNVTFALGRTHINDGETQTGTTSSNRENDDFRMEHALFRADKTFDKAYVQASVYYLKSHEDQDGPGLTPDFKVAWLEDSNGWLTDEVMIAQVNTEIEITPNWQSRSQLAYTQDRQNGEVGTLGPFSMNLTSELSLADWQNSYLLLSNDHFQSSMQWGLSAQHQWGATDQNDTHESQTFTSSNLGFSLAGLDWTIKLHSQWNNHREFDNQMVYSLGAEWQFTPHIALWANTGKHFRAPAVNERLHPIFGNTELKPEKSSGGELGLRLQVTTDLQFDFSVYQHDINDLVVLAVNPATGATRAGNIANVSTTGAELVLSKQWSPRWNTTINYSYMDAEDTQSNNTVAVRPEHRLNLINEWQITAPLNLHVELNSHNGYWFDANNTLWSGSVVKINAALDYQLSKSCEIYLRVDNLTNDDTVELFGFNYPHRSVYIGSKMNF